MRTGLKTCFYVALAGVSVACFAGTGSGESPPPIASPVPLPEVPAVRATYEAEGCAGCHGAQAEGGPGVPALRGSGLDGLAFADAVGLGSPTMPASQTLAPAALEALRRWLIGPVPAPADGPAVVAETVRQANRWARRVPPAGEDADPEAVRLTRRAAEQARRVAGSGVSPPAQGALESLTETVARLMDSSEGSPPAASLVDLLDQQLWPLALDAVLRGGPPGGVAGVVLGGDGRPLAGALVLAEAGRGFAARATDAAGRFRLPELPAVPALSLWALHPEQGCLRQRVSVASGMVAEDLVLRLAGSHAIPAAAVRDASVSTAQEAAGAILSFEASLAPEASRPSHVWAAAPALGTAVRLRPEGSSRYTALYRHPPEAKGRIAWQFWAVVPGCTAAVRTLDSRS